MLLLKHSRPPQELEVFCVFPGHAWEKGVGRWWEEEGKAAFTTLGLQLSQKDHGNPQASNTNEG